MKLFRYNSRKEFKMRINPSLYKSLGFIIVVLASLIYAVDASALTAKEAFDKAKTKVTSATSLTADFSMKLNGTTVKGKIYSKGKKFAIITNATSSWYNGTNLYTYDPSAQETYLFNPTSSELKEVNPLLYLNSASGYKISGTKNKKSGIETVVLIPSGTGSGVKNVTIDLDSKTYLPKSLRIVPSTGDAIDISISGLKINPTISDTTFDYPKSKYPNATITDMR